MTKKSDATHTIDGPVGVSNIYDAFSPNRAEDIPTKDATIAIISGEETTDRAEAAGIISIEIISSTPTTFIPTATTIARAIVRIKLSFLGWIPLAEAKSSLSVTSKSEDHRQKIRTKIIPAPSQMKRRSNRETAKISPIK